MSDTVKLIIEIPKGIYEMCKDLWFYDAGTLEGAVAHGIPLNDVKAEIDKAYEDATMYSCDEQVSRFASIVCGILNSIGKAESEE